MATHQSLRAKKVAGSATVALLVTFALASDLRAGQPGPLQPDRLKAEAHREIDLGKPHASHGAVGGRWVGVQEIRDGRVHRFQGAGMTLELPHEANAVEWELAASLTSDQGSYLVPLELVALHPSHPTSWLQPFVGLGVGLELFVSPTWMARPAAVVCSGARLHMVHDLDFVMEVSALAPLDGGAAELHAAAGLAVHLP